MILRIEHISKSYARSGSDRVALSDVSLELCRGQVMGVFGGSGAGKTTLLRIAAGLESPDCGVVSYKGERLDRMSAQQRRRYRRREVGCIWAEQAWPTGLSVLEHVPLPLLVDGADHRSAERLAGELLLACEAEQCLGVEPEQLSDGERQRVRIARALVTEPRLLLADGAVSNLSIIEQEGIMVLLQSLAREAKVAVLITDTDATALLRADPILYLSDGRLANADSLDDVGQLIGFPTAASRRLAADA